MSSVWMIMTSSCFCFEEVKKILPTRNFCKICSAHWKKVGNGTILFDGHVTGLTVWRIWLWAISYQVDFPYEFASHFPDNPLHNQVFILSKCPASFVKYPCEWYRPPPLLSKSQPLSLSTGLTIHGAGKQELPDWWEDAFHWDQEKSGQFKVCYCILNVTGVKETDEPGGDNSNGVPPGLVKNHHWENGREAVEEGGRGINLRGGGNRSFLPPFPALSHLWGLREAEQFKRSWPCPT